jgi:hypothetical protein
MHCPACEGSPELVPGPFDETIKVGTCVFTGTVPSLVCPQCHVQRYTAVSDMKRFELTVAAYLAHVGKPTGEMVAFTRKALGHTAIDLAKLLDISPEHLSRMEHNKRGIDRLIYAVLGALAIEAKEGKTQALLRLQTLALEQPCPATVKVEV